MVAENIQKVRRNIERACKKAGRDPSEVTLVCVSKTKPVSLIMEAYEAGERVFGENHVQEIVEKVPAMPGDIKWHMIGHLQRNKVKSVIDKVTMIHSLDSIRLAQTLDQEAEAREMKIPVLIEINVAEEESKFGITIARAYSFVRELEPFSHLDVQGLMTIAPLVADPEENREIFRQLKKLSVDIGRKNINNISMNVLSMGMTGDYEVAVEEGATMVRVGTGIFGERGR